MKTVQPKWRAIAQLGDRNPVDYGGLWVLIDTTGQYPAELEKLDSPPDDDGGSWTVYRVQLEQCTLTDGILSDNPYHPDSPVWFADKLDSIGEAYELNTDDLVSLFCSPNPTDRARAYECVADHYGWHEFDHYPLTFNRRGEVNRRYRLARYRVK